MKNFDEAETSTERVFLGSPASPGIAIGRVYVHLEEESTPPSYAISEDDIQSELDRLEAALLETRKQILETQERVAKAIGDKDASIFDAHLLVVEDQTLLDEVVRLLRKDLRNIEDIYARVAHRYASTLSQIEDPYLRERAVDIEDVTRRVIRNLLGQGPRMEILQDEPCVILAESLTPADTAGFDREKVLGFATEVGSRTSHVAIMARSLGIPAIVGLRDIRRLVHSGDEVLVDGFRGRLVLNPSKATTTEAEGMEDRRDAVLHDLETIRETAAVTTDGTGLQLSANIDSREDIEAVIEHGARGVGLFRTEFFFIRTGELPDETEQYELYRSVVSALRPDPVIIRTLDIGGDKLLGSHQEGHEDNPFLGWRAIRFCLEQTDIFKAQLRAILRASVDGNASIMYPMVSGIDEVRAANAVLRECREELKAEGVLVAEKVPVGAMIEVPSAALCADIIAKEVDFFSIGTNDLIQYTIAVDRVNERVAKLYAPTHPAIVRLLKSIIEAGHSAGIWVGVCGEMAGEVVYTPLLIGLGVDEFSTGAASVPAVKRAIQRLDRSECVALVTKALKHDNPEAIYQDCLAIAQTRYPELLKI